MRAGTFRVTTVCLGLVAAVCLSGPVRASDPAPPPPPVRPSGPVAATDAQLDEWLQQLVDLPTSALRRASADRLAEREGTPTAQWLTACARFGVFKACKSGLARTHASLGGAAKTMITTLVPPRYDPAVPTPLLMAYHGSGGDGRWAAAHCEALARKHNMLVVAPHEPRAANGYTATPGERDAAWAALRWARRQFNVDERRIYAVGFSRGGHLVWDMALRQPDRFAGIAPIVGGPRINLSGNQNNLRYVENLIDVGVWSVQGAGDDPRMLHNVNMAYKRLRKFRAAHAKLVVQPDRGHDADWLAVDWSDWVALQRTPSPTRIVRRSVQGGAGRAGWVEILEVSDKAPAQFVLRVPRSRVAGASDTKIREIVQKETDKRTARLEARRQAPGKFTVRIAHVLRARLLLDEASVGKGDTVQVRWRSGALRKPVTRSTRVLLREFAERFDRTFLPVVEVQLP